MSDTIPIIELSGNPFERGLVHGERLAGQIAELSELEAGDLMQATKMSEEDLWGFAEQCLPIAEAYSPDLFQELRGIAEGANLPLQRIFILNAFLDLYDLWIPENKLEASAGCTSYGFVGDVMDDGNLVIGQNLDLHQRFQDYRILLRIPLGADGSIMVYSFPGMLGCVGLNSHGLGVLINKLFSWRVKPGVPYPMLVREFLQQSSFSLAIGSIVAADRISSMNYLVANKHEIVDIETTADDCAFLYPRKGKMFHSNHYVSERLLSQDAMLRLIQLDRAKANTYVRYAHFKRVFDSIDSSDKVGIDKLYEISRSHEDYPLGICHHSYVRWPEGSGRTIAVILLRPELGEIQLTDGPPCECDFESYFL
jgi:isopenicillin-N N-acyltransferase-like protein